MLPRVVSFVVFVFENKSKYKKPRWPDRFRSNPQAFLPSLNLAMSSKREVAIPSHGPSQDVCKEKTA
jgi:hypothetical protein